MLRFTADTSNLLTLDMVAIADGSNITVGTVTAYLVADSGTNIGKWWNSATETWSATEASSGAMTYKGGSAWQVGIVAGAWDTGVSYTLYGQESGSLNVPYSESVTELGSIETTVEIAEASV